MTRKLDRTQIAQIARIVTPATAPAIAHPPRSFELPTRLYALTVSAYLAFIAVLVTAFATREMILPAAIFVVFIAGGFGVPAMWARMHPETRDRALDWSAFRRAGIQTHTGRMTAGDATIQVLVLPALILLWGVTIAVIAALLT